MKETVLTMIERASAGEQFKTPSAISFTKCLLKGAVRTDKEIDCGMYIGMIDALKQHQQHPLGFILKTPQSTETVSLANNRQQTQLFVFKEERKKTSHNVPEKYA